MNKKIAIIGAAIILPVALGASSCESEGVREDRKATETQLQVYQDVQPVPGSDWSQYRETLLTILYAQVNGVATTTFFFEAGIQNPVDSCPSVGFPVPSTAQLTNPLQALINEDGVIAQMEPSGVYTGDSQGTYVVCVSPDGAKYVDYWEGEVKTKGGPASWDNEAKRIVLDGQPTTVSKEKE